MSWLQDNLDGVTGGLALLGGGLAALFRLGRRLGQAEGRLKDLETKCEQVVKDDRLERLFQLLERQEQARIDARLEWEERFGRLNNELSNLQVRLQERWDRLQSILEEHK